MRAYQLDLFKDYSRLDSVEMEVTRLSKSQENLKRYTDLYKSYLEILEVVEEVRGEVKEMKKGMR